MLTNLEEKILSHAKQSQRKVIPTSREMAAIIGCAQSLVVAYYARLEKKGVLARETLGKTSRFVIKKKYLTLK